MEEQPEITAVETMATKETTTVKEDMADRHEAVATEVVVSHPEVTILVRRGEAHQGIVACQ